MSLDLTVVASGLVFPEGPVALKDGSVLVVELMGGPPVLAPDALMENPQLVASGYFAPMERAFVGRHFVESPPFTMDGERPRLRLPAPLLGEHTAEALGVGAGAPTHDRPEA